MEDRSIKPEVLRFWDYSKNTIDPKSLTFGSNKRVWWKYPACGHEFSQLVKRLSNNPECKICRRENADRKASLTKAKQKGLIEEVRPELAGEYSKNNERKISEYSIRSYAWVNWVCSICSEEWSACISERVEGRGQCPVCTNRKIRIGVNDLKTVDYKLYLELKNKRSLLAFSRGLEEWICSECQEEWKCSPFLRIKKERQCPHCFKKKKKSKGQLELEDFIKSLGETVEADVRIPGSLKEIDVYLPKRKIGFEFNGDYWHSDTVTLKRKGITSREGDLTKMKLAAEAGLKVFFVWESDWLESKGAVEEAIVDAIAGSDPDILKKLNGIPIIRPKVKATKEKTLSLKPKEFTLELQEIFKERYFKGESPFAISKSMGFEKALFYEYVKDNNLVEERQKYGFTKNGGLYVSDEKKDRILSRIESGAKQFEVCEEFGINYKILVSILHAAREG